MYNYKDVTPRYNQVITTAKRYKKAELSQKGLLLDLKRDEGRYSFQQQVVKVGPNVRDLKPGDWVEIDFSKGRYVEFSDEYLRKNKSLAGLDPLARASHLTSEGITIRYPVIMVGGEERFLLYDDDIFFSMIPEEE